MFPGKFLYALIAVIAGIDLLWVLISDISVSPKTVLPAFLPGLAFGVAALTLRLLRHENLLTDNIKYRALCDGHMTRFAQMFEGLFFISLSWVFVRSLNHLTMSIPLPWMDETLIRADQILHLDWAGYFNFVISRPWLCELFANIYISLTPLSIIAFTLLMLMNRVRTAELFTVGFVVTCLLCILIGMLFPAYGAVSMLYHGADDYTQIFAGTTPGVYHIPYLEALRTQQNLSLDLQHLPGLVTFPSFHTAACILLIWCYRQNLLFWPVTIYALLVIASTPVMGGHYFIDLLGGTAIAMAVMAGLQYLPRYRDLFMPEEPETLAPAIA